MVVGTRLRRKIPDNEFVYNVKSMYKHDEFKSYHENDIGLIYTDRDIQFSSKVELISLMTNRDFTENQIFEFAGWGHSEVSFVFYVKIERVTGKSGKIWPFS